MRSDTRIKLNTHHTVDLSELIESKLLLQANSGGGKSWAARRLIEQAFGKLQIIIIDPEGEFGNMRAKYDFLYIGRDGDAPAEPRSAALLARRLLETQASAIIDIYELGHDRKRFVRLFFEAMVNAPKELWHDVLIILDEAHKFAPEKEESEALTAVADMASLGRKRGFCLVAATQRPAKLSKDVAAELNNKLIGRASLDIDRKRSAEELGFNTKEQILSLRNLEPGQFYAFGPAISRDVELITIGDVTVKPPKRGQGKQRPPAPTQKVRKMLAQFKDLPQEAQKEAQTVAELNRQVKTLTRELGLARGPKAQQDGASIDRAVKAAVAERDKQFARERESWRALVNAARSAFATIGRALPRDLEDPPPAQAALFDKTATMETTTIRPVPIPAIRPHHLPKSSEGLADKIITSPEQRVLDAIAFMTSIGVDEPAKEPVAFLAGYTPTSGSFKNACGALRSKGFVSYPNARIALTAEGWAHTVAPNRAQTHEELHTRILDRLGAPERKLLTYLIDNRHRAVADEELAIAAGYTPTSGSFKNARGRLRTFGLVTYPQPAHTRAADLLFPNE